MQARPGAPCAKNVGVGKAAWPHFAATALARQPQNCGGAQTGRIDGNTQACRDSARCAHAWVHAHQLARAGKHDPQKSENLTRKGSRARCHQPARAAQRVRRLSTRYACDTNAVQREDDRRTRTRARAARGHPRASVSIDMLEGNFFGPPRSAPGVVRRHYPPLSQDP
jgi:hypothetical protein